MKSSQRKTHRQSRTGRHTRNELYFASFSIQKTKRLRNVLSEYICSSASVLLDSSLSLFILLYQRVFVYGSNKLPAYTALHSVLFIGVKLLLVGSRKCKPRFIYFLSVKHFNRLQKTNGYDRISIFIVACHYAAVSEALFILRSVLTKMVY